MGVLLKFPEELVPRTSKIQKARQDAGKIIIFEGVRYSRSPNDSSCMQEVSEPCETRAGKEKQD